MASVASRFNPRLSRSGVPLMAKNMHAPDRPVCPSCRGKKEDRFGFDCTTCFGEGHVDE